LIFLLLVCYIYHKEHKGCAQSSHSILYQKLILKFPMGVALSGLEMV